MNYQSVVFAEGSIHIALGTILVEYGATLHGANVKDLQIKITIYHALGRWGNVRGGRKSGGGAIAVAFGERAGSFVWRGHWKRPGNRAGTAHCGCRYNPHLTQLNSSVTKHCS